MFESEYAVEITVPSGESVSLFADRSLVEKRGEQYYLQVQSSGEIGHGGQKVLLPSEALETGSRWLEVHESDLETA